VGRGTGGTEVLVEEEEEEEGVGESLAMEHTLKHGACQRFQARIPDVELTGVADFRAAVAGRLLLEQQTSSVGGRKGLLCPVR